MHWNHFPSLGLCKVVALGIDRAHEVELLFAPPAFELFFPSDGYANVFLTLKVEQALAAIGRSDPSHVSLCCMTRRYRLLASASVERATLLRQPM
jgi:hypothetical protein